MKRLNRLSHFRFVLPASFVFVALLASNPPTKAAEESLAFSVEISLSQKAAAKLAALPEGIIVSASYSGDPAPGAEKHTDQIGRIPLGIENIEAPGKAGTVSVTATKIKRNRFVWIKGPVLLNVNVYSARHSGPDNILACDFFDGNLEDAVHKPMSLHCSLIAEGGETKHKE
jgi:hypothetical protein